MVNRRPLRSSKNILAINPVKKISTKSSKTEIKKQIKPITKTKVTLQSKPNTVKKERKSIVNKVSKTKKGIKPIK